MGHRLFPQMVSEKLCPPTSEQSYITCKLFNDPSWMAGFQRAFEFLKFFVIFRLSILLRGIPVGEIFHLSRVTNISKDSQDL